MDEIFQDFIQENDEFLLNIEKFLLVLDEKRDDEESINEIFRAAHTIKGTSAFLELYTLADVTHAMEDLLQRIRGKEIPVDDTIIDSLFIALDCIKEIQETLRNGQDVTEDYSMVISRLSGTEATPAAGTTEIQNSDINIAEIIEEIAEIQSEISIENIEDDPVIENQLITPPLDYKDPNLQSTGINHIPIEETIRIKVGRLNNVINLIGEMVTINSGVNLIEKRINDPQLSKLNIRMRKVLNRLRNTSLSLRMMPISHLFDRFPRLVRDLNRKTGKKVKLVVEGGETEIDKNIIEDLYDPLLHLIRNSIDHGVETPQERINTGKPVEGVIHLSAQHQEDHVIITVSDDGAGINFDSVLNKACQQGIISNSDSTGLNLDDVINLIFEPGFSTVEKISDISGRGVGMDIVRSRIEELHGAISVTTTAGEGTSFLIRLPVTLAITQVLVIKENNCLFGIPLISVSETAKIPAFSIEHEPSYDFFNLRGEAIRLIHLSEMIGMKKEPMLDDRYLTLVIIHYGENKIGLVVDQLVSKQEIVLKMFGSFLGKVKGVMGASILGNGELVPVLESGILIREYLHG